MYLSCKRNENENENKMKIAIKQQTPMSFKCMSSIFVLLIVRACTLPSMGRRSSDRLRTRSVSTSVRSQQSILACAFFDSKFTSLKLPASVTHIGEGLKAGVPTLVAAEVESLSLALSLSSLSC